LFYVTILTWYKGQLLFIYCLKIKAMMFPPFSEESARVECTMS